MDVQNITPDTTAARQNTASTDPAALAGDFETFLQLLTAQMRFQDPLQPVDSTDWIAQLAQFSGVEQQVMTNRNLEVLQSGIATLGLGQLGSWIGMEARAEMPVVFDGSPVALSATPAETADRMELIVRNDLGDIVQRLPIPLSDRDFEWDGRDLDGTPLPSGTYDIAIQNWRGEDMIDERAATSYGIVQEARIQDGAVLLTLAGGTVLPANDVLGLRRPA